MTAQSSSFRTRTVRAIVATVAIVLLYCVGATASQSETGLVCTLFAEKHADVGDSIVDTFAARVDCSPGILPPPKSDSDPEPGRTQLQFEAKPGERVIIGASLTDEAPSGAGKVEDAQPDFDFPIRFITIPGVGVGPRWSFAANSSVVAGYGHLIMRVWNPAALAECPQGRDGCEKFGYILLWDQRRAEGALDIINP